MQGLGHCNACHGNRNALGATRGAALGGGQIAGLNWYAPSLVSRTEAGIADWQVDDIVKLLATGIASRGVASGPMAEVVTGSFSDSAATTGSSGASVSAAADNNRVRAATVRIAD